MQVEFTVRIVVEVPDSTNVNFLSFGDVGSIIVDRMNHELIDYETENCVKLQEQE